MTQSTSDAREVTKPRADTGSWLRDRLLHECEVMATYALSSGIKIPDLVVQTLALGMAQAVPAGARGTITDRSDSHPEIQWTGNDASQQHGSDDALKQLVLVHNRLVELVAPATPRTIDYLNGHLHRPRV